MLAGKPVELRQRNYSVAARSSHVHTRIERDQRNRHVRRMRRDARLARTKYGVHPIVAADGGATGARRTLVAWRRRVTKVCAARTLQEVSSRRRHVAELPRRAGEQRQGQHWIATSHRRVMGEI